MIRQAPSQARVNTMYFLLQIGFWGMMATFSGYQTAIVLGRGFSSGAAGLFIALGNFAGIFAQPLLGRWADAHPETPIKRILTGCMLLALSIHVGYYFTRPGLLGSALVFLALGALETNAYPLIDAMAMQYLNTGMNVRYSLGRGLGAFSYAVLSVLVGWQALRFGVESAQLTYGVMLLFILLTLAGFPTFPAAARPSAPRRSAAHSPLSILQSNRPFSMMLLAGFFAIMAVMPIVNFLVQLVGDRGGDSGDLGLALFLMAASELPGAILFQCLRKRFGTEKLVLASIFFMMLKPLFVLLARDLWPLLLVQPIQMLGYGMFSPGCVYYANESVPPEDRIQGQSLKMMVTNGLGGVVGNLTAGLIIDWGGLDAMLWFCLSCGIAGVALAAAAVGLRKREIADRR